MSRERYSNNSKSKGMYTSGTFYRQRKKYIYIYVNRSTRLSDKFKDAFEVRSGLVALEQHLVAHRHDVCRERPKVRRDLLLCNPDQSISQSYVSRSVGGGTFVKFLQLLEGEVPLLVQVVIVRQVVEAVRLRHQSFHSVHAHELE